MDFGAKVFIGDSNIFQAGLWSIPAIASLCSTNQEVQQKGSFGWILLGFRIAIA